MFRESNARTVVKTLTWRVISLSMTSAVVWLWTRRLSFALAVGSVDAIGKMFLYYAHERGWERVRFGRRKITPAVFWLTGLSGAGKTTLAAALRRALAARGYNVEHLDGGMVRRLFPTTGFSPDETRAHVRRVGTLASVLEANGTFVVASMVSPHADARDYVRSICRRFVEIHVSTPIEVCEQRERTGLYERARLGKVMHVAGVDGTYEAPLAPELGIDLGVTSISDAVQLSLAALETVVPTPIDARREHQE